LLCRNWNGATTTLGRSAADRRRRTTTTTASAYRGGDVAIGAAPCHLLPVDAADHTTLDNGSVSVRFPAALRGVYAVDHYTYIAGRYTPQTPPPLLPPAAWASAHRGRWGQLTLPGKMDEK